MIDSDLITIDRMAYNYVRENHSPSKSSDFQAAMNIAALKAYSKGANDILAMFEEVSSKNDYSGNPQAYRYAIISLIEKLRHPLQ